MVITYMVMNWIGMPFLLNYIRTPSITIIWNFLPFLLVHPIYFTKQHCMMMSKNIWPFKITFISFKNSNSYNNVYSISSSGTFSIEILINQSTTSQSQIASDRLWWFGLVHGDGIHYLPYIRRNILYCYWMITNY